MEPITQETQVEVSPVPQKPKRTLAKKLMLSVLAVLAAGVAYVGITNPELFRAALLGESAVQPTVTARLFIPSYDAGPKDNGSIAIKVKREMVVPEPVDGPAPAVSEKLVSVKFKLKWEPADALVMDENSIILDTDTFFKPATGSDMLLKSVNTATRGEALVSILTSAAASVNTLADKPLFKLNVQLNGAPGSKINLVATEFEAIKEVTTGTPPTATVEFKASDKFTSIDTGAITIVSQNKLRVLRAESVDNTHVLVRFSDLLKEIGVKGDYVIVPSAGPDLSVAYVEAGDDPYTVLLTTIEQTAGLSYNLTVGAGVKGNTQLGFESGYNVAKLYGFGNDVPAVQSTFAVTKAVTTAADKITLTFSEPVAVGSVSKEAFSVKVDGSGADLVIVDATPSGNTVVLTLDPVAVLAADKTALVTVNSTTVPVRRASDNAVLGFNKATVAGFGATADLALTGVEVLDNKNLLVSFSANLDQASVSATKFKVDGTNGTKVPASFEIQTGFQKVKLTFGNPFDPDLYTLVADTGANGILPYGATGKYLVPYMGVFSIAQAPGVQSAVKLVSVDVNSSTKITLHFSGALMANTVLPVNMEAETLFPAGKLTLVSATLKDAQTVEVVTAQQDSDKNYFLTMAGVKDASGLTLGNNRVMNFLGFKVSPVVVRTLKPAAVTNEAEKVVAVLGENLDTVASARIGNTEVQVSEKTAGAMSLTIPKGFTPGSYDLNLLNVAGQTSTLANALTVQVSIVPMKVVSEASYTAPARIAPDGKTAVTLYAVVEDPTALNQVSRVSIDLSPIGGTVQDMEKGAVAQNRQIYSYTTMVPTTVATKADPYVLNVEALKGTEVAKGTVSLMVTKATQVSVPPVIDQLYANPSTMVPDGEAKGKISARITDADGASTIKSVVADLGELGVGFVKLTAIGDDASMAGQQTGSFISTEFSVPKMTSEKAYTVTVTAQDETGATATKTVVLTVSTAQNAPKFDAAKTYIGPRKSVPRDGKTSFSIHAMVSDPDGVNDIESVTAYFGTSGLKPEALTIDPTVTKESTGKSALWNVDRITIPSVIPLGIQDAEIVAVDKAGGKANIVLQFEVTDKDTLGEKPFINSAKSYTAPKIALNDGKTPVTLYAFVRDDDENLESVVVNLANLGQIGPELPSDFGESGVPAAVPNVDGKECGSSATGIVCMVPGFKEGNLGQWWSINGVTVSKDVAASDQPYKVEVIATDVTGNVTRGQIPVSVRDSLNLSTDKTPPAVIAAVPVGSGSIEVLFSKPLDAASVAATGSNFTITQSKDVNQKLNVFGSTIDAAGRVVTLTTDAQASGTDYVLSVSSKVMDTAGIPMVAGRTSQFGFRGFQDSDKVPVVDSIGAMDGETVQIDFMNDIRPSSVKLGESAKGGDFSVKIAEVESGQALAVKAVRFVESGKSLEVKTDMQKSATRYRVTISNVASAAGIQSKSPIAKFFKSINIKAVQKAAVASGADLNGDGKVDFIDFTMFSAVYGQTIGQVPADTGLAGGQGLNPITPTPDSLIPHTSNPGN
jgi:hypothetical protein